MELDWSKPQTKEERESSSWRGSDKAAEPRKTGGEGGRRVGIKRRDGICTGDGAGAGDMGATTHRWKIVEKGRE